MTDKTLPLRVDYLGAITVSAAFVAFHRWAAAPEKVAFLRDWHRHKFNVKVSFAVGHNDRDLEFFLMQQEVNWIIGPWNGRQIEMSCEMFASEIAALLLKRGLPCANVTVDEDGENSASISILSMATPVQSFMVNLDEAAAAKLGVGPALPTSTSAH